MTRKQNTYGPIFVEAYEAILDEDWVDALEALGTQASARYVLDPTVERLRRTARLPPKPRYYRPPAPRCTPDQLYDRYYAGSGIDITLELLAETIEDIKRARLASRDRAEQARLAEMRDDHAAALMWLIEKQRLTSGADTE